MHTPTPWWYAATNENEYAVGVGDVEITKPISKDTAAFIVRAVNSHDAMVAALEQAINFISDSGDDKSDEEMDLIESLESALATAKGE